MKTLSLRSILGWSAVWSILLSSFSGQAVPYASGLTNAGGTISFRLNEDADNVTVVFDGGANSLDLGNQTNKGPHSFALGTHTSYQIVVTKNAGQGYPQGVTNQLSVDTNNFIKFANGRGLAVNQNPASPHFGRIYVACGTNGVANGRATGDGIYILTADQTDAVGQGDVARTAGISFNSVSQTEGPFRLAIGADDNVYITDNSDVAGALWVTDPDVTTGTNVLEGIGGPFPLTTSRIHGSILAVHPEGTLAAGNLILYVMDEDLQTDRDSAVRTELNSIWQWDIGAATLPFNGSPAKFAQVLINTAAQYADMRRGPDGKWYCSQRRAAPATTSGVIVRAADGFAPSLWSSLQASRDALGNPSAPDIFVETRDVAVSPDGKYMASINNTNGVFILPLTDGIPDMTNRVLLSTLPTTVTGRAVTFDPAGNLYTLSSGQGVLRVYSPGGYTIATTGSDGTFNVVSPLASVSVTASDNYAHESSDPAELIFSRSGDPSSALTVNYTMSGTAANGSDYSLPGSVTFAPGEATTNVTVIATDDSVAELTETVFIAVVGATNYTVGSPAAATIDIADNETPELSVATVSPSMYERIAADYATFSITRRGDTNVALTANLAYGGVASSDRYTGELAANLDVGQVLQTFKTSPVDDALLNGNETITATMVAGTGYVVGTTNSASTTILDDEWPAETILFADSLAEDTSSLWTTNFAANNQIDDYFVGFAYDVNADGVSVPPNGSNTVLKLTVNKNEATAAGAAGINLYPVGRSFSGDFAVRLNMYLAQNSVSGTTEFALLGILHSGAKTNWLRQNGTGPNLPVDSDGLWFSVIADASGTAPGDYALFTSTNAANAPVLLTSAAAAGFVQSFKKPPYSPGSASGVPANVYNTSTPTWADVEVKKIGSVITLSLNKTQILQFTNNTAFTSGNLMLGYTDPYESIGTAGGAVYYSNLRVVNLSVAPPVVPVITNLTMAGGTVMFDFHGETSDTPASFTIESTATLGVTFAPDAAATAGISAAGPGMFHAMFNANGATRFYRIRR